MAGEPLPPELPVAFTGLSPKLPSARGYLIGGLGMILATLAVGYAIFAIVSFVNDVNDFQRFKVPGKHVIHVRQPGMVDIFADVSSSESDIPELGDLKVGITSSDGRTVRLREPSPNSSSTYDLHGRHGQLIALFRARKAGDYQLVSQAATPARVAVGHLGLGSVIARAFVGFGIGFLLGVGSLVLLIITGVRRGSAKRSRAALELGAK